MKQCVVTDLDGTLANLDHRLHYVKGNKRDYDKFFELVYQDGVIDEVREVINLLFHNYPIIVVSARSSVCKTDTVRWLMHNDIQYDYLLMREEGDYRKDTIVKQEILDRIEDMGYWPVMAFDDRRSVCSAVWRANGIRTFEVDDWEERETIPASSKQGVLHVLVGPSGAGKSTFAHAAFSGDKIVSSDAIRKELCGDSLDQSKNDEIFKTLHSLVKHRIQLGLETVVDATNIRNKDRKAIVELANGGPVVYHVINRPMDEKVRDGDWRNDVDGLMERHENTFKSNLKDILNGDGYPNVTVKEMLRGG